MKCKECTYWVEAQGTQRTDDVGGCTFNNNSGSLRYFPMFLHEECNLKEPFRTSVTAEHSLT